MAFVIMMIQTNPPPRPKCYSTDELWRDWLVSAHTSGLRVVKRVDTGKLSLQNTAALSEHEKKLRQIESIIKHMESRGGSRG